MPVCAPPEEVQSLLDDADRRAGDVEGAQALETRSHQHGGVLARHSPEFGAVDAVTGACLDAVSQDELDLALQHGARQPVLRDARAQQAAELGRGFQDGHAMAESRQVIRAGKPRRPGADHRHRERRPR